MVLFAEENHTDLITGLRIPITNRLWTISCGEAPRPIFEDPKVCSHEWWDADGVHAWSVWGNDTWRSNVQTGELERIEWPVYCLHAHCSVDGRYLVCDSTERFYRGCATSVHFMDRQTGKTLKLIDHPAMDNFTGNQLSHRSASALLLRRPVCRVHDDRPGTGGRRCRTNRESGWSNAGLGRHPDPSSRIRPSRRRR
jgi:hypothetical protein